METFVNEYYNKIEAATTEAERAQIKDEFTATLQTLSEEQRQEVKTIVGSRIYSFLETLAPIDEAIDRFNEYLEQRQTPTQTISNAA